MLVLTLAKLALIGFIREETGRRGRKKGHDVSSKSNSVAPAVKSIEFCVPLLISDGYFVSIANFIRDSNHGLLRDGACLAVDREFNRHEGTRRRLFALCDGISQLSSKLFYRREMIFERLQA